jgi:hypothetical protein
MLTVSVSLIINVVIETEILVMVTKEQVKELLANNNRAVERALMVLFAYQTADEQQSEHTSHSNGRGFNSTDAAIMSSMAKWVLQGRSLSMKQLAFLRGEGKKNSRIGKYAGQLAEHANENPKVKAA